MNKLSLSALGILGSLLALARCSGRPAPTPPSDPTFKVDIDAHDEKLRKMREIRETQYTVNCEDEVQNLSHQQGCGVALNSDQILGPSEASLYIPPDEPELTRLLSSLNCQFLCSWLARNPRNPQKPTYCEMIVESSLQGYSTVENQTGDAQAETAECQTRW